jgi:hypothetical protein
MVSNDGSNYTPQYDAWIARAGVSIILTGAESTLSANGILGLRIANGHFAGISMQVDAKMLASYDKDNKEASNAALTVGAFIDYSRGVDSGDWKLNFAARITAEVNLASLIKGSAIGENIAKAYTYPTSSTEAAADGKSGGMSSSWLDKKVQDSKDYANEDDKLNKLKNGEVGGSAKLQIPIDFYVKHYPDGQVGPESGKQTEWFFAVGRPNHDDRVIFSSSMDLVVCSASTEWTLYVMTGNYFPGGFQLPEVPEDVQSALGSKYATYQAKRSLPTLPAAGGFAFGGSFHAEINFDMFLYVKASATLGFDLALLATNGAGCPGYSEIGKNGFYAMGQAYAMMKGEVGLSLNLGFWKGHLSLASASVAALLQGGGPKPTWAYGLLAFKASCLGGLIKINTSVDFSLGHVCVPGNSDPLANVKLFQNVTPAFNTKYDSRKDDNVQSAYTTGTIVSNLPWNEPIYLCADQKYGNGTTTRKFQFVLCKNECSANYTKRMANGSAGLSSQEKTMVLKFSANNMETNMQYFQWTKGGLPEYSDIVVTLKGRAFEWRPTYTNSNKKKDEINLSDEQRQTDYYYTLYENNYSRQNTSYYKYPNEYRWRDPVFTDRDVTIHDTWTQDTTFYLRTSKLPNNLDDAVVFTWPYNGDPMFPIDEFVSIGGRKRALIYLFQGKDFLNQNGSDNQEIKAFLVLRGIGANNDALACDYHYYPNGYLGSSAPCIEVVFPSTFTSKYQDYDMAVRIMLIKKDAYQATLKQLQAQANQATNSMQQKTEVTKRSSAGQRLMQLKRSAHYSGEDLSQNVEYQQLLKSREEQDFYGQKVSDTNIAFARKMLKNDYAICLQTGSPIYTLYFRLYSGSTTYSEILGKQRFNWLFGGSSIENQTTSISAKHNVNNSDYDDKNIAKYAYLFATYTPTDIKAYHAGITLPPIIYAVLDWNRIKFNYQEFALYNTYATRLIDMDNAVKNTWSPSMRPSHLDNKFKLSSYHKGWTDEHMGSSSEQSAMYSQVFTNGFVKSGDADFTNIGSVMNTISKTNGYYTTINGTNRSSFPRLNSGKVLAPNIIKMTVAQPKWRYDSTSIGQSASKTIGGNTFTRPEYSYCNSYTNIDEAIPAIYTDIKRYHDFYQDLFDYALYVHSRGWSYKRDQYKHLIKYTYRSNKFTTNNFPYTVTRSTLFTWWMWHWRGIYWAGQLKRRNTKYDNMKYLAIPYSSLTDKDGVKATYWMTYILHWDQVPYMVADDKGTLYKELFTNEYSDSKKFSRWRTSLWFNGETTGGGTFTASNQALVNVSSLGYGGGFNTVNYSIRYIPITYYYLHGGSSSSDYYIFGKIADAVRQHNKDGKYDVMANTYKQTDDTYHYSITTKSVQRLKDNSGITFRAINTKNEESSARDRQSGQWE